LQGNRNLWAISRPKKIFFWFSKNFLKTHSLALGIFLDQSWRKVKKCVLKAIVKCTFENMHVTLFMFPKQMPLMNEVSTYDLLDTTSLIKCIFCWPWFRQRLQQCEFVLTKRRERQIHVMLGVAAWRFKQFSGSPVD